MAIPSSAMPRTSQMLARRRLQEMEAAPTPRGEEEAAAVASEKAVLEKMAGRSWQINLWLLLAVLLLIALATALVRAFAEASGLWWLLAIPELPQKVGDFNMVLAPLLAVAIAIERLLETGFNWYEQSIKSVSEVVAQVRQPIDWIEQELQNAYTATEEAARGAGVEASQASLDALDHAEKRLGRAEQRLLGWVRAPEYMAWKRAVSIWVGLLVGLEVAVWSDLGMLHIIGVPVPRLIDMLMTGLVIGAGPGPMHSLIGILQSGKDALQNLSDLAEGKAVREAAADVSVRAGNT